MADDDTRDDEPDVRDQHLGAQLEVEPLDEVARRRLVSTAMRATERPRTARAVAVAAALLVVLVIGFAVVASSGGGGDDRTASPALSPSNPPAVPGAPLGSAADTAPRAETAPGATPGSPSSAAAPRPRAPVDVGDFGDLDQPADLARLRAALLSPSPAASADRTTSRSADTVAALASSGCRASLPRGTVTAVATGTLDGRPAIVTLTETGGEERSIDALLTRPCEVRPLS